MADVRTEERWLPIVGFEGFYEISSRGRVWSVERWVWISDSTHCCGHRRWHPGRFLHTETPNGPYCRVSLSKGGGRMTHRRIHVLVAAAFLGPRPRGHEVRHINGDSTDNRIENLRYGTSAQNKGDMIGHGRQHQMSKTHCVRGHLLQAPNLVIGVLPHRNCLACLRARNRVNAARRHGATLNRQAESDRHYTAIMRGDTSLLIDGKHRTTCPHGHPLDATYTSRRTGKPVRYCSTCSRAKRRRQRAAKKAQ